MAHSSTIGRESTLFSPVPLGSDGTVSRDVGVAGSASANTALLLPPVALAAGIARGARPEEPDLPAAPLPSGGGRRRTKKGANPF